MAHRVTAGAATHLAVVAVTSVVVAEVVTRAAVEVEVIAVAAIASLEKLLRMNERQRQEGACLTARLFFLGPLFIFRKCLLRGRNFTEK